MGLACYISHVMAGVIDALKMLSTLEVKRAATAALAEHGRQARLTQPASHRTLHPLNRCYEPGHKDY